LIPRENRFSFFADHLTLSETTDHHRTGTEKGQRGEPRMGIWPPAASAGWKAASQDGNNRAHRAAEEGTGEGGGGEHAGSGRGGRKADSEEAL